MEKKHIFGNIRFLFILNQIVFMMSLVSTGADVQKPKVDIHAKIKFMQEEILYLDGNFEKDNAKWNNYKSEVTVLAGKIGSAGADSEALLNLEKSSSELHDRMPLRLPSGPAGTGRFGAYYTKLKYNLTWDKLWKVSGHADVVVRFDEFDHRFVFWRGTSYIPHWATYDGAWFTNEFFERRGFLGGCDSMCEPMSDKQCRYSHVRIIESNPARVVVHWRYSPTDLYYKLPYRDKVTGWADWVDEFYTIYPDSIGVRKATIHTGSPQEDWIEYQESIVVNQPGTIPEDNINYDAVTFGNLKGQSKTYTWTKDGGPDFNDAPESPCIQVVNFKNKYKPFSIVNPDGVSISPYGGHGKNSHFNWWNHWPVNQEISDTTGAESSMKPSHSSLSQIRWKQYSQDGVARTWIMLNGMTDKSVEGLVPIGRSWVSPAGLDIKGITFASTGYDATDLAYHLICKKIEEPEKLEMRLAGSELSPIYNPAFVIEGWGKAGAELKVNNKMVSQGKDYRYGYRRGLKCDDLIVWFKAESTEPMNISIIPTGK